jgi:hypothetical protein
MVRCRVICAGAAWRSIHGTWLAKKSVEAKKGTADYLQDHAASLALTKQKLFIV